MTDANYSVAEQIRLLPQKSVGAVGAVGSPPTKHEKGFVMKKGKLSRDVIRAKDRDKKQDTAFRIQLGKDDAGMQILEIRSGERTAIIAATDLLPPLKQVSEKLLAQGMPVLQRQRLEALQSAAQRALERQKPAFTLVSRPGWVEEKAFVHGQRLVGSLPKNRVFRSPGIDLGDRPAKFSAGGSLEEWQELVRRVARDEPLVTFLLCVAFASMILHLLKVQPFAILLHAKSSVGKSYLGKFVASVAGGDPCSPETGFAKSFKATDVGLEKLFLAHNNLVLVLNELSRVPAEKRLSVLEAMVNDLCAGTPKTRGTDSKGALRYSTCGIITSNDSYQNSWRRLTVSQLRPCDRAYLSSVRIWAPASASSRKCLENSRARVRLSRR